MLYESLLAFVKGIRTTFCSTEEEKILLSVIICIKKFEENAKEEIADMMIMLEEILLTQILDFKLIYSV